MTDSFPRQAARTIGFTLGAPRSFQIAPDGQTVVFLRSKGGTDPVTCLWALDVATGTEWLVADPAEIAVAGAEDDLVERARRERARERAAGIVGFATDKNCTTASFALTGHVYLADLAPGGSGVRRLGTTSPAADPRPDPAGRLVAYVSDGALRVHDVATGDDRMVADPAGASGISFGLAEFVAAEEMDRSRGYWWAPDGSAILTARVDETPVHVWHIADPANPERPANAVRYPAAGTPNAVVSVYVAALDGNLTQVQWDSGALPYLVTATWEGSGDGRPLIVVASRDQRDMRVLAVDPQTGETSEIRADTDPFWLDIVPGVPATTASGRIVWTADVGDAKRLQSGTAAEHATDSAAILTPDSLNARDVLGIDGETILFSASADDPAATSVWTAGPAGLARVSPVDGSHDGLLAGGTLLLISRTLASPDTSVRVLRPGPDGEFAEVATIGSLAETPNLPVPKPQLIWSAEPKRIRTAIVLPSWHEPGSGKLPVLCDPYGGPHGKRVLAAGNAYLSPQWLADQGFAVVIADGRGTPGRGYAWDRAVAGDLAGPVLDDQVEALMSAAEQCADLDTSRVGIRGWSFGGYLAALAVLRRPDVFHAGIAGAPPTDWRLYDTYYTERYLGLPDENPAAYEQSSLLADAPKLTRPLLLIHGLSDDNVAVAHTLRLSSALLAAGRPHSVLPLSGVTHMASQEEVAENLLLLQVDFLRTALGIEARHGGDAR
ncbi:MAG TPA: prolyl oligopeptidase family serine peptidase [Streptosporangiaceae bacterium]|nr:prolyl oligopeptidase family serine peptidase [Streptosporangiaceae bacterium]